MLGCRLVTAPECWPSRLSSRFGRRLDWFNANDVEQIHRDSTVVERLRFARRWQADYGGAPARQNHFWMTNLQRSAVRQGDAKRLERPLRQDRQQFFRRP
jgi:hypothetical protein